MNSFIFGMFFLAQSISLIFNIEKIISSKNLLSLFSNNLSIYHLDLLSRIFAFIFVFIQILGQRLSCVLSGRNICWRRFHVMENPLSHRSYYYRSYPWIYNLNILLLFQFYFHFILVFIIYNLFNIYILFIINYYTYYWRSY